MTNQKAKGNEFTITKKIAKHGSQAVIVIPKILQEMLKPQTIVQIKINVLEMPAKMSSEEEK